MNMEALLLKACSAVYDQRWLALLVVLSSLTAIYRLWTRTRYLGVALERLGAVSTSRENALAERITDRLLKRFFAAPKPTLESLANDTTTPYRLEPSTGFFPKREK
jgi:hypothetical protein